MLKLLFHFVYGFFFLGCKFLSPLSFAFLRYLAGLLIVSSFFAWDFLASGLYSLWLSSFKSKGRTQLLQLVLRVVFRVCRTGMGWCWVGYIGSWSSELYASFFSWMLPAIGYNILCLCSRQCSHLETDTLNSGAVRPQLGRQVWARVVLLSCFTAVPQPDCLLAAPCAILFWLPQSLGMEHPSFSFPAMRQYSLWAFSNVLNCAFL